MGTHDQWGDPCVHPEIDELLGIARRGEVSGRTTFEAVDESLREDVGAYVSFNRPHQLCETHDDVLMLAHGVNRGDGGGWDGYGDGVPRWSRHPGIWQNNIGQGSVVVASVDWFTDYLHTPTNLIRKLFGHVLSSLREPVVSVEAPFWVTANTRQLDDGAWLVNLHNCPGTMYNYPNPVAGFFTHSVGDVPPIHDVRVTVNGRRLKRAESFIPGDVVQCQGQTALVPKLELHTAIRLEW